MAQKALSELTTITEMGEGDTILIESEGKMKRLNKTVNEDKSRVYIMDLSNYDGSDIYNTILYNEVLEALDMGKLIYANVGSFYAILTLFYYGVMSEQYQITLSFMGASNQVLLFPSEGQSQLDIYQPVNLTPGVQMGM